MTYRTTWQAPEDVLRQAELVLTELIEPPVDAASLVRDDDASAEPSDAPWLLHVYTDQPLTAPIIEALPADLGNAKVEELEDRDWVAHALEGLGVVKAGPFILYGSHDADKIQPADGIPIQIEANQAFGTGHHPTTGGCLEALAKLESANPNKVLDIGTGSGILSFASRRLWPSARIIASDIDETSVAIAKENGEINGIADSTWLTAPGTDHPTIKEAAPYDLVIANILAGPLVELASDIKDVLAPHGLIILAGLLDEQQERVVHAYKALALDLVEVGGTSRWPTLTLRAGAH
ncbi:MAG: 50S ribosomal protein L11 methyltransferase [Pseudomonadota bacterium]